MGTRNGSTGSDGGAAFQQRWAGTIVANGKVSERCWLWGMGVRDSSPRDMGACSGSASVDGIAAF